jgi:hypothetical protein
VDEAGYVEGGEEGEDFSWERGGRGEDGLHLETLGYDVLVGDHYLDSLLLALRFSLVDWVENRMYKIM